MNERRQERRRKEDKLEGEGKDLLIRLDERLVSLLEKNEIQHKMVLDKLDSNKREVESKIEATNKVVQSHTEEDKKNFSLINTRLVYLIVAVVVIGTAIGGVDFAMKLIKL